MELSENALEVLNFRYLKNGETPEEMINRVAIQFSEEEKEAGLWYNKFYSLMESLKFVPNTPTLVNAGKGGQLSACFVLEIKDSIKSIFGTLEKAAQVHKSGGGTGFDFSKLRPANSLVSGSDGIASGPVSFMRVYNAATREMKQGGVRRGANMGILRVDHPDIIEFIRCKNQEGNLENFNISVAITDEFLEAVNKDMHFDLYFNGKTYGSYQARYILKEIANSIWLNGEPGIVFIDRINQNNPLNAIETIDSTNPCGEMPLPPNGSCNLGHINLAKYWNDHDGIFLYSELKVDIETAVRFLDNGIDINKYPNQDIKLESLNKRRIGLGIMGLADLLLMAGYTYGSDDSLEFIHKIMNCFKEAAETASYNLGKEKGYYMSWSLRTDWQAELPNRRNGCITTVAPTGSCSIIADCSSGIEPVFAFEFDKKCLDDSVLKMYHPLAKPYLEAGKNLPSHFITAKEISPEDHIRVQATVQRYIDSGISKTINVYENTTPDRINYLIMVADSLKLKSLTLYRDNSRKEQAQYEGSKKEKLEPEPEPGKVQPDQENILPAYITPYKRKKRLEGFTWKIKTGRGKLYVTVNEDDQGLPVEVFAKIGKSGREDFAYTEAIGRLISLALRSGVPVERIFRHMEGITGYDSIWDYEKLIKSVPDAIAQVLNMEYNILEHETNQVTAGTTEVDLKDILEEEYANDLKQGAKQAYMDLPNMPLHTGEYCPECQMEVALIEGCKKCISCGYSKCGG